jgi:hypothetical protein
MKVTVAFRDDALLRAAIRVELNWLDRLLYRTRGRKRAWNDTVRGVDAARGGLAWVRVGTGEFIANPRIVDAINRERTKTAEWRRLAVIARHT